VTYTTLQSTDPIVQL